jgi:hypothetical protein
MDVGDGHAVKVIFRPNASWSVEEGPDYAKDTEKSLLRHEGSRHCKSRFRVENDR